MNAKEKLLRCLLLLLLLPPSISLETIAVNQSITGRQVLVSKEGTFALGFFRPGNSRYVYLGIWYHKLPGKTVVWVANRNNPINDSLGVLLLNTGRNLVVVHSGQNEMLPLWSTNTSLETRHPCVAQLLDSGNLVFVLNQSRRIVWQSFDYPTDTILPGMKIGLDLKAGLHRFLTSWRSADDPATGNYSFKVIPTDSPQIFFYKDLAPYWRVNPWPWNLRNDFFVKNQHEVYFSYLVDDESVMMRETIDSSGSFKRMIWDNSSAEWKITHSLPFKCGFGHCGANSICNNNHAFNVDSFECSCLPGYEPKSLKKWSLRDGSDGCVRKRQETSICRNGEGFINVGAVKVADTSVALFINKSISRSKCEKLCLRNCSCTAFASFDIERNGVGCLTWYGGLIDTQVYAEGKEMYVRVDATELGNSAKASSHAAAFLERKDVIAIILSSVALAWFVQTVIVCLLLRKRNRKGSMKHNRRSIDPTGLSSYHEGPWAANEPQGSDITAQLPFFNLSTISAATDDFSAANKLGQGGFGSVYKGQLPSGQEIAVKRLTRNSEQGIEEFKTEVKLLAELQHRNLVKLVGCCIHREERMIVYEYLPNTSLDAYIFDGRRQIFLDWRKRFDIIVGIARGILYLHQDSRLRVIHRDLKCSNILLDAHMNPKISDFGMARLCRGENIQERTNRVAGTFGYMSPEYALFGKFSVKSDVFSFGVILLEILSGKRNSKFDQHDPSSTLIGHVWKLWKEDRAVEIVDSLLMESYPSPSPSLQALRCIQIGLLCVQEEAEDRPTMLAVVYMLNSEATLPSPKQPAFTFKQSHYDPKSLTNDEGPYSVNEITLSTIMIR